ncbi:uncharacterized protein V6R79_016029 [Siganus canaliculatus]
MSYHCFLVVAFLLSLAFPQLVAMETCPATGMPGIPGIPGSPGLDGRDGEKGEKGDAGSMPFPVAGPQKGQKGEAGPMGISGKRGPSGETGDPGPAGRPGPEGEPGESGAVGEQQRAAFSVARATREYPNKVSVIRFTTVITNLHDDYNTTSGRFRCRVPGSYYFVYHASLDDRLCVLMKLDQTLLASFCDHRRSRRQVTSGSIVAYLSRGQELWLETKDYRGMRGMQDGQSIFSGFLLQAS